MKYLYITLVLSLFSIKLTAQNLEKLRTLCIDEVNLSQYSGSLSKEELQKQIAALGFRYVENGQVKYHKELIIYDCNTGNVQFTAVFDENRLNKEFLLYESKDVVAKKILFSKNNESPHVDLKLNYRGQDLTAYPVGKTEIFKGGKLKQTILFSDQGALPKVTNFDGNLKKTAEGTARISGKIQEDWTIAKIGEWKFYENGQLVTVIEYDNNGNEIAKEIYSNGKLTEQVEYLASGAERITAFYKNGNINQTGLRSANSRIDTWKFYSPAANLQKQVEYSKGQKNVILTFDKQGNLVKRSDLVWDKSDLIRPLQSLSGVYKSQTFYAEEKLKSDGFEHKGNKVGVFELYDESGNLSEIREYDLQGKQINTVDAKTYKTIKQKEKEIFRELLVSKTTNPINLNYLSNIEKLTDSLGTDFDSLMMGYDYKEDYQTRYADLEEQTSSFGKLSNKLSWYDSLLSSAQDFNNEIWAYSHDLFETELALEKEHALNVIKDQLAELTENHTRTKKTLFGKKLVVVNEQEAVYETVSKELYPNIRAEVSMAQSKQEVHSTLNEFERLLSKASNVIQQPDEQFQQLLEDSDSVEDKRQLFLTAK